MRCGPGIGDYLTRDDAVSGQRLAAMRAWVTESDLVGSSPLKGTFTASRGFAVTFTRAGLAELERRFPALWPFVEIGVLQRPWRPLLGALERLSARLRDTDAFYLNVLVVPAGANVSRHVDATLSPQLGEPMVTPRAVSVLYLDTPPGGSLRLWRGEREVASIAPKPGMLVCFRGELGHDVAAVTGVAERISIVCEQYAFGRGRSSHVPPFKVTSKGHFDRVLERVSRR
jgi:hypothetical protein